MPYIKIICSLAILILATGCVQVQKPPKRGSHHNVISIPSNSQQVAISQPAIISQPTYGVGSVVTQQPVYGNVITQQPPIYGNVIIHPNPTPIPQGPPIPIAPIPNIFSMDSISSPYLQGSYSSNYKLKNFINNMVTKHGFRRDYLNAVFSSVRRDTEALQKIGAFNVAKPHSSAKTAPPGSWDKYRANFLTSSRIEKGVKFWRENEYYLNMAAQKYGVAPAYIVGIIGVETNFGGFTGKHSVLNALTSISLEFPKRSKFFTMQLENYLLMTREERIDPRSIQGSYAGAFGLSQFMPDSFRDYAVDHDGNGQINLFTKADAIGSVANFFKIKGKWNENIPVAVLTTYPKSRFYGLNTGFKTRYSQEHLLSLGMRPVDSFYGYRGEVALIKLSRYSKDELWWATPNFNSIARYNPKDHYAMAVHQLAQAVRMAYWRQKR